MAKVAALTYGEALFELALEKNTLNTMAQEAALVKQAIMQNLDLVKLLVHPQISKEEKIQVIETIFRGKVSDDLTGFLVLIVEKDRAAGIVEILNSFLDRAREHEKIGVVFVTSAVTLTQQQKQKVETKLLAVTDYVKLEMNYTIDSSLIGGMVIRIGDRIVDNSIRTKLLSMKQGLLKVSLSEN